MPDLLLTCLNVPTSEDYLVALHRQGCVSYSQFLQAVRAKYTLLSKTPGSALALYETDGIQFATTLFAAWHAGKSVYLPGNILPATIEQLQHHVDHFVGEFPTSCRPLPLNALTIRGDDDTSLPPLSPSFPGVVVFTSGSTGEPQAIAKQLHQLANEVATLQQVFGEQLVHTCTVATVSHQHIYGLLFKILWPLASQRPFWSESLIFPEAFSEVLAMRPAILISSPAHLKRLPDTLDWQVARAQTHAVFSSAGPLPDDAVPLITARLGKTPMEVYGSSETGGIAWRQRTNDLNLGWTTFPGVQIQIENELLIVQSPHLPDTTWYGTADRASIQDNTHFVLLGRNDRIAKIEGKRVSLVAVENALQACGWTQASRVLMLPDTREHLAAVLELNDTGRVKLAQIGKTQMIRQLRQQLANSIEPVALPRRWRFIRNLPTDSQGKCSLSALAQLFAPTQATTLTAFQNESNACMTLAVTPDLLYFDGHFPQAPVLPGVAQVDWVIREGRSRFGITGQFTRMEALKFQRIIHPGMQVELELDWRSDKQALSFKLSSSAGLHASGRVIFE
ncbi:AMP-binding protein [Chitinivorax sp. B]|uniref:ApeI family dehydratase n=1 Tax=Chitinivorax sp. B TaxID=2502235 RepID=UPI0010F62836|nr:AMP-binding protein [Chitinivorax sp. B]